MQLVLMLLVFTLPVNSLIPTYINLSLQRIGSKWDWTLYYPILIHIGLIVIALSIKILVDF